MSNVFNLSRFGQVMRKDFMENRKGHLLLFLGLYVAIVFTLTSQTLLELALSGMDGVQVSAVDTSVLNGYLLRIVSMIFMTGGLPAASSIMRPMSSKLRRIAYLSLPASNFEKFLSRWLLVIVGYMLTFCVAAWLADIGRVAMLSVAFPTAEVPFLDWSKLVWPVSEMMSGVYAIPGNYAYPQYTFLGGLDAFFLLQSVFMLGATFWQKRPFVKTLVAVAGISLAFVLVCRAAILIAYGGFEGFHNVLMSVEVMRPFIAGNGFVFSAIALFTLANWTLTYFRLRETGIHQQL